MGQSRRRLPDVFQQESESMKTNAMRILDGLGIRYEIREYEVHPDDLTAERVAHDIGLPAEQVFKTLVVRGDRHGVLLARVMERDKHREDAVGMMYSLAVSVTTLLAYCKHSRRRGYPEAFG